MSAQHTVQTRDLRVHFYEKSFKIDDMGTCVWTGRAMGLQDMKVIAHWLQSLVERGRHPHRWREMCAGQKIILSDPKDVESWQAQEIAQLKAEIEELKIERVHQ